LPHWGLYQTSLQSRPTRIPLLCFALSRKRSSHFAD
jgi:hypothetical protein